jgi:hypothetical protein
VGLALGEVAEKKFFDPGKKFAGPGVRPYTWAVR